MKRFFALLLLALLTGCAGYSYPVQDGGDGVYYASSPPNVTYVNVPYSPAYLYAMPYGVHYSPYFYPYYFSVSTSPLIERHYHSPHYWAWNRPYYLPPSSRPLYDPNTRDAAGLAALYSTDYRKFRHQEPIDLRGNLEQSGTLRPVAVSNRSTRHPAAGASAYRRPVTVPSNGVSRPAQARLSSPSRSHRPSSPAPAVTRGTVSRPKIHRD